MTLTPPKIIIFELNEIPYQVFDHFVRQNPGSCMARASAKALQIESFNPDSINLHPRISWQTFHRGVPDTKHGILQYNQDTTIPDRDYPRLLDQLRAHGVRVGNGATIGSYPVPEITEQIAFWLPDPFAATPDTFPETLRPFQEFNLSTVAKSGRVVRKNVKLQQALRFMLSAPRLGISVSTWAHIAGQLVSERLNRHRLVRRRTTQSLLNFDVVMHQIRTTRPTLATLFSNHVASSMHRYWAAQFDEDYEDNQMPHDWRAAYKDEIMFTMRHADAMMRQMLEFATREGYKLLMLGSMGQHAIPHELVHTQSVLKDVHKLMRLLGFQPGEYQQLGSMEPEYVIGFNTAEQNTRFRDKLTAMQIGERHPIAEPLNDTQSVFWIGQRNLDPAARIISDGTSHELEEGGIAIEEIQDKTGSTAQHVPEGLCMLFDPARDISKTMPHRTQVDLTAITASLLAAYGVKVPAYMPAPPEELVAALQA